MDVSQSAFTDIEGGVKTWLKTHALLTPLVSGRVFLGLPRQGPSAWPAISIIRVGGGPSDGDYPADQPHLQIDCWGNPGDKTRTFQVAQAVVSALLQMPCGTLLGSAVRGMGAYGIQARYIPDPETGRPRYSVECVVMAQALVAPI